ncbi:hypothetical protein PCANC_27555 [Puccinia coronata f. sp. avenae]|uniref:Uncharacterized protein n=1 Tax=Puccinia coronata f. sp. avenae TaxID=200324 RepID=A0A2N5TQW5_9BASI|nr:hypothetical protein PCANC_27555 [Puccinia coronata f. sp. avenae]
MQDTPDLPVMSSLNPHSIDVRVNAILHIIKRFVPKIKLPAAMSKENAIGFFQKIHLSRSAGTASINWSNTPVQAVLNPPCLTSDWTGVSDRLGKALVGHAGPITGQMRRFNRCLTRPVQPANAGRVPALTGQTRPFEHLSNRRVQPVIGPACPTGSEEHRSNPAKPITGRT